MSVRSLVLSVFALGLVACGHAATQEAKTEANPWADYKGTYASSAAPKGEKSSAKPESKDAKAKAAEAPKDDEDAKPAASAAAPAPTAAKKMSKTTINGQSISSIDANGLADVSKSALKSKVTKSKLTVGAHYEQVQVQLQGVAVQIVRPASSPQTGGPAVASPKQRNAELSKTESAWYDEEADVLIVVNAPKKATSQKALGSLLER